MGGMLKNIWTGFIKKIVDRLFPPDRNAPPPLVEYSGPDVNLISANKHQEGKGAIPGGGGGGGDSGWLGGLPGLTSFKSIFSAQTNSEVEQAPSQLDEDDVVQAQNDSDQDDTQVQAQSQTEDDEEDHAQNDAEEATCEEGTD